MSTIDIGIADTAVRSGADTSAQRQVKAVAVTESSDFYVGSVKIESQPVRSAVSRTATGANSNPQRKERRARARPNQPAY